jgi:hypothetical protein
LESLTALRDSGSRYWFEKLIFLSQGYFCPVNTKKSPVYSASAAWEKFPEAVVREGFKSKRRG